MKINALEINQSLESLNENEDEWVNDDPCYYCIDWLAKRNPKENKKKNWSIEKKKRSW